MAKGGSKRRAYVRDANGRFASSPGGGLSAARKAARSTGKAQGTLAARSSLKTSRAKLRSKDKADPTLQNTLSTRAQKGAVTRGNKALRAAKASSQRTVVGRSKVGTVSKARRSPVLKTTVLKPEAARVPAAQRPGSMTSILRGAMGALAKADAQRIREIESITGQKVRPTAAGIKAGKEAGARVRATAKKKKVSDTLRAGLRELAQSDARTMRGLAEIVRDATPKVAGGKGKQALKGAKKALAAAAAPVKGKPKAAAAPAPAPAKPKPKPKPKNKDSKGKKRWLSNEQVIQANEARGKDVRRTADVFSTKLPKKQRDASGVSTVGAYIAKYAGKSLSFAQSNLVKDQIEKVTGVGYGRLGGVRETIDNAKKTVTYRLTPVARRQAEIGEKRASRKRTPRSPAKPKPASSAPAPAQAMPKVYRTKQQAARAQRSRYGQAIQKVASKTAPARPATQTARSSEPLIMGLTFAQIQSAQQGRGFMRGRVTGPAQRPRPTTADRKALRRYGIAGLQRQGMFGIVDRLQSSGAVIRLPRRRR